MSEIDNPISFLKKFVEPVRVSLAKAAKVLMST
jgi:hypothetical protein